MRLTVFLSFIFLLMMSLVGITATDDQWGQLKGQNFIIYYRDDVPLDFVETVMETAEQEFQRVTTNMGFTRYQSWAWEKRASIYIYSDENDYVAQSGQAEWSQGAASIGMKAIKTFPAAQGFFDSTLPHELGHIIFSEYIGTVVEVPLWFEEGVAMYQEKAKRWGVNKVIREAIKNDQFIPLSQLTDMRLYNVSDPSLIELFYAESASVVYFILTQFSERHFYNLCRELKANPRFEDALSRSYMRIKNINDLNKQWVQYLGDAK